MHTRQACPSGGINNNAYLMWAQKMLRIDNCETTGLLKKAEISFETSAILLKINNALERKFCSHYC